MQLRGTEALQLLSLAAIGDAVKMPLDDPPAELPPERGAWSLYIILIPDTGSILRLLLVARHSSWIICQL